MKTIIVEAKVGKVYAPKRINVFINNMDNDKDDQYFECQRSFKHTFQVGEGRYVINVIGMNQSDDETVVKVSGDFQLPDSKTSADENYVMVFIGEVN